MEMIKLKNGAEESPVMVATVHMILDSLLEETDNMAENIRNVTVFYDIVTACRDPKYMSQISKANMMKLEGLALVKNGRVHDSIKNVVLSSVEGEELEMELVNPVMDAPQP